MVIEVTIAADGTVTTKVEGGCGKSCADATKVIRDAIGETTEDKKLPAYYQQPVKTGVKQGQGGT